MSSKGHSSTTIMANVVGSVVAVGLVSLLVSWYQRSNHHRITKRRPSASQYRSTSLINNSDGIVLDLFRESCHTVKSLQDSLSNGDQLMLYGLYKQATEGDADVTKKPSALNMVGTLKFQAWMQFQSMPRTAAMMHYIQAVGELGNTDNSSEEGDAEPSSAMGLKPSIMLHEQVHALDDSATWEEKLRRAASQGSYETMMHLLNNNNNNSEIDINAPDDSGQTALHFCADRGHLSGVELLLENGAVVDSIDHDGISVLQAAVIAGHVDICSVLLQNGADPDHLDSDGDSPKSCAEGDDDIMELFRRLNPSMEE